MIAKAGRAVVVLFALLGFACVPLGRQTGLQHVVAILKTSAAANAGRELVEAATGLRARLVRAWQHRDGPAHSRASGPADLIAAPGSALSARDAGAPDTSLF